MSGWLPPGVTDKMIDDEANGPDPDAFEDGPDEPECTGPSGAHEFECTGVAYGGDDESYHGEGRSYCIWCGADGDA